MGKGEDFKTESLAFIEKFKDIGYYDEKRWFSSAYSTLNPIRTIEGGGLSEEEKKTLESLLFSSIKNLKSFSVSDYDKWFYELAKEITGRVSKLSFGHAQKLINILMKYHFVYFYSDLDGDWKKKHSWLVPYFSHFHAPIDRKVLANLTKKYSMNTPYKFSWTKWQWKDKALYEEIQNFAQKIVEKTEIYNNNRLYFEMKELWKNSSEEITQQKWTYGEEEIMQRAHSGDSLKNFLEEIVKEINKQGYGTFELNDEPRDYFSIQRAGAKKYKNVVCFPKNEPVLSINKYANIPKSLVDNPPYNKLKKRPCPPRDLQLRREDLERYPHNLEYNLKEDKDVIFQLCKIACENFRRPTKYF